MPRLSASSRSMLTFAGAWFLALLGIGAMAMIGSFDPLVDVNAYWQTGHGPIYSPDYALWRGGYSYSPAFAQIIAPLTQLPWEVVQVAWLAGALVAYAWLLRPIRLAVRVPLVIASFIWASDNLYWPLALVAVHGFRFPSLWALPLLTKITPGVGVTWFLFRREWRAFAIAIGTTLAIAGISFAFAPDLWRQWFDLVVGQNVGSTTVTNFLVPVPPLPVRGLVALAIVWWGARSDRRAAVPVAMFVAQPDIAFATFGLFAAIPRLRRSQGTGGDQVPAAVTSAS